MAQKDSRSKTLFSMPGYRIKCFGDSCIVRTLNIDQHNNQIINMADSWNNHPLAWINKHRYVLSQLKERIMSRKINVRAIDC